MSMFSSIGNLFHGGGMDPGRALAPGNEQWSNLANFFPEGDKAAGAYDLANFYDNKAGKKQGGHHIDVGAALSAIGAMGGSNQTPPAAPQPDWLPPPPPRFLGGLQNAPQLGQRQMMPPPAWMQPYLWGGQ